MKKAWIVGLWVCLGVGVWANTDFFHKPYDVHLNYTDSWTSVKPEKGILSLVYPDTGATLNVRVFNFSSPVTANGLQMRRVASTFDGWRNIGERFGTSYEIGRANVEDAYLAIYAKTTVDEKLSKHHELAVEYYYTIGKRGYIISVKTEKSKWKKIKEEVKDIADTFWVGKGDQQPQIPIPEKRSRDWAMPGKNAANHYSIEAHFAMGSVTANMVWSFKTKSPLTTQSVLMANNRVYLADQTRIYSLDIETGKSHWEFSTLGPIKKGLAFGNGMIYFVAEGSPSFLYGVTADSGNVVFKSAITSETYSAPILFGDHLLLADGVRLNQLERATGELIWDYFLDVPIVFEPVATQNLTVLALANSGLVAIDGSGKKRWTRQLDRSLAYAPTIAGKQILISLTATEELPATLISVSISDGETLWTQSFDQAKRLGQISYFNQQLGVGGVPKTGSKHQLWILDAQTGKIQKTRSTRQATRDPAALFGSTTVYYLEKAPLSEESGPQIQLTGYQPQLDRARSTLFPTPIDIRPSHQPRIRFYDRYAVLQYKRGTTLYLIAYK